MNGLKLNNSKLLFIKFHSMESNAFSKSIKRKTPEIFFTSVYSIRSFKSLKFGPNGLVWEGKIL